MNHIIKKVLYVAYIGAFSIYGHGLVPDTLIQLADGSHKTIGSTCLDTLHDTMSVLILYYFPDEQSKSEKTKTRYQGEKALNWKEFKENCHIGQKYGKKSVHTGKYNPKDGSPVRQLSEDIPNTEIFKKGHFFALDRFHDGDHLEVWDKKEKWIGVANLDGSKNEKKTSAVTDKHQRILSN